MCARVIMNGLSVNPEGVVERKAIELFTHLDNLWKNQSKLALYTYHNSHLNLSPFLYFFFQSVSLSPIQPYFFFKHSSMNLSCRKQANL